MNITRKPVTSVQTMFNAVWPAKTSCLVSASSLASSAIVGSATPGPRGQSGRETVKLSFPDRKRSVASSPLERIVDQREVRLDRANAPDLRCVLADGLVAGKSARAHDVEEGAARPLARSKVRGGGACLG